MIRKSDVEKIVDDWFLHEHPPGETPRSHLIDRITELANDCFKRGFDDGLREGQLKHAELRSPTLAAAIELALLEGQSKRFEEGLREGKRLERLGIQGELKHAELRSPTLAAANEKIKKLEYEIDDAFRRGREHEIDDIREQLSDSWHRGYTKGKDDGLTALTDAQFKDGVQEGINLAIRELGKLQERTNQDE